MKLSIRQPTTLGWALALLLAAMLLSASGARAAANRGAVLVRDINPGRSDSSGSKGGRLTNVSGTLYVSVDHGKHGYELWRSVAPARGRGW